MKYSVKASYDTSMNRLLVKKKKKTVLRLHVYLILDKARRRVTQGSSINDPIHSVLNRGYGALRQANTLFLESLESRRMLSMLYKHTLHEQLPNKYIKLHMYLFHLNYFL